jgi:hypothetical protein
MSESLANVGESLTKVLALPRLSMSLRVKLLVGFTLAMALLFAGTSLWFLRIATQIAENQLSEDLERTLEAAVTGIDADAVWAMYQELSADERCQAAPGDAGFYPPQEETRYWEHVTWLEQVHEVETRARLYTYFLGTEPNEMVFIGSNGAVWAPEPAGAPFCYRLIADNITPPAQAIQERRFVPDFNIYDDEFGTWGSGYMPVYGSDGELLFALGGDLEASTIEEARLAALRAMVPLFVVTYVLLFIVVFLVSGFVTRPMMALAKAAGRIGEGDYEQDLSTLTNQRFPDEIGVLARVFDIMVGKVYQREQKLRQRVQELEILIDEHKRDQQVSEIVDSDFFQDLAEKAKHMRRRGRTEGGQ